MRNLTTIYRAALAADDAYTRAIRFQTGGQRDRWTATAADETAEVIRARDMKLAADAAWLEALRSKETAS